jgi:hypothetical protein
MPPVYANKLVLPLTVAASIFLSVAGSSFYLGRKIEAGVNRLDRAEERATEARKEASAAHDDSEAALRDAVDRGARLKTAETRLDAFARWMSWEWSFVHGRIDHQPWHNPRTPPPDFTVAPTPEGS